MGVHSFAQFSHGRAVGEGAAMKESLSRGRVLPLVSYTLRTKAGTLRVEDDGRLG
jgi:hypothetical protein